ncbi:MAG: hypothetical protein QCI82_01015 [Candidatus Thermoplasmatota archaeon]|nr:hypothetical protein [Candidatus Thermoplasmatota archaeon]
MIATISAIIFTFLIGIVILFQGALVLGAPWGSASMGGKYPGKYPPKMRIVAVSNMFILAALIVIVLARAELVLPSLYTFSRYAIWAVVLFTVVGTIMNTITPSRIERIWAPVTALSLIASLIVALN